MISVVVPLYNKEKTILKTISSVLTQSYEKFEIIVVNDGSTDGGVALLKESFNDERITIINQENQGVSAARNNGIRESNFDYIALLDGDDEWLPGYLEKVSEAIEQHPEAGMYGTASWHIDVTTGFALDATIERYRGKIVVTDYFENPVAMSHTSATVFTKRVYRELFPEGNGFPVGVKMYEDWSCTYQFAFTSPYVYIGFPLGVRNNAVEGQVTGAGVTKRDEKVWDDFIKFYQLSWSRHLSTNMASINYPIFMKFELRGIIINALRKKEYAKVQSIP